MPTNFPFFIVVAFTDKRFCGNPAGVCFVNESVGEEEKQKLAAELNLPVTCFPIPLNGDENTATTFALRWFTPTAELHLCGHATLGAAQAIFNEIRNEASTLTFQTPAGDLLVTKKEDGFIEMDFPQYEAETFDLEGVVNPLATNFKTRKAPSYLMDLVRCLVPTSFQVMGLAYTPVAKKLIVALDENTTSTEFQTLLNHYDKLLTIHPKGDYIRGIIVTLAPKDAVKQGFADSEGKPFDYAFRFFDPWVGANEDPACGSAQCSVSPFWSKLLGKKELRVMQPYPGRGAEFRVCLPSNTRTLISGKAVTLVSGTLKL